METKAKIPSSPLKPSPGFVVVLPQEEQSLVKTVQDERELMRGLVLACGTKVPLESGGFYECPVKVGDIILIASFGSADTFKHKGITYKCLMFRECRGVFAE